MRCKEPPPPHFPLATYNPSCFLHPNCPYKRGQLLWASEGCTRPRIIIFATYLLREFSAPLRTRSTTFGDAKDYNVVRRAILRRYSINEETYRQRFRGLKPKEEESPQELMTRLEDLASRWTKDAMTREEVVDILVREQFLSVLPHDVRVAVMERQPKDCSEASQFAENYLQARASSIVTGSLKTPSTKCPKCGRHGHWARDCPRPRNSEGRDAGSWTDSSGPKQGQLSQGPRDARSPTPTYSE